MVEAKLVQDTCSLSVSIHSRSERDCIYVEAALHGQVCE